MLKPHLLKVANYQYSSNFESRHLSNIFKIQYAKKILIFNFLTALPLAAQPLIFFEKNLLFQNISFFNYAYSKAWVAYRELKYFSSKVEECRSKYG